MRNAIYFIPGTVLFVLGIIRQMSILFKVKKGDPLIDSKILFPVFNICYVMAIVCVFNQLTVLCAVFYTISSVILFYTYYKN